MKTKKSGRVLSVLLSALMLMGLITPALSIPVSAEGSNLIAEYFSTDSEWYDAVTGSNQLDWQGGDYTSYQNGFHYFNGSAYLKILTQNLFSGVSESTGISFSYQWKPDQSDAHRHIISLGTNDVSNVASSFYITATTSWMSNNKAPFVGYVRADGNTQTIGAYPLNAPDFALGTSYDITVVVSVGEGVIFYINGIRYEASYYNSNFSDQQVYIREFLNAVSGWNNNYIGVSRWPDGNIKGWLKDLCIYNTALSAMDLFGNDAYDIYTSSYADSNLTADLTQTDAKNQFSAEAYHQGVETTGAYNNLVYSPIWTTSWSGNGVGDTPTGVGRTDFKVAIPRNVVMVYDGVTGHEPYAPITLETRCNDTNGSSHIIHYADYNNDISVFELKNEFWQGYSRTWDAWAKDNIIYSEQFAAYWHNGGAPGESPDSQRDGDSRFWWNMIKYFGTGNTSLYYDHESNFKFDAKTSYKTTSRQYKYGTFISLTDFYTINYQPVYDALPSALACYNELTANGWMYTEESLKRAKATIAQMVMSNPNNAVYTYGADTNAAVQNCAVNIGKAVALLGNTGGTYGYEGLELVKKTGVAVFNYYDGTEFSRSAVVNYGDSFTVPSVPAKDFDDQYHYVNPVWDPSATPGSAVMSDDYNKTFTASYTQAAHTYTGSPAWGEWTAGNTVVATFTCDNCGHTITPQVTVTSATTGPTCTDAGYTVYTATVTNNGTEYTNPTTKRVDGASASGHTYAEIAQNAWTWTATADGYTATVTVACERNDDTQTIDAEVELTGSQAAGHLTDGYKKYTATAIIGSQTFTAEKIDAIGAEGHSTVHHDAAPSTKCTETGTKEYWSCTGCEALFSDENAQNVITDISDNTYGPHAMAFDSFIWAADGESAQAKYVCGNNAAHFELYDASMSSPIVVGPTCTTAGYTEYTATYDGHSDTNRVTGAAASGHSYVEIGENAWVWTKTGDGYTATVTVVCERGDTEQIVLEATVAEPSITPASHTDNGSVTYTATATDENNKTFTATKTDVIEATGHNYVEIAENAWTWTKTNDGYTATVTIICEQGDSEQVTLTASVDKTAETPATHLEDGSVTYTATATDDNGKTFNATKIDVIEAEGHSWNYSDATYVWNTELTVCTATVHCTRCSDTTDIMSTSVSHNTTQAATCMVEGVETYTAAFEIAGLAATTTRPISKDMTNHVGEILTRNKDAVPGTCVDPATWTEESYCSACTNVTATTNRTGVTDPDNHATTDTYTTGAVEPGYTYKGYTGDVRCAACREIVESGNDIDKLDISENAVYKAAGEVLADASNYDATAINELQTLMNELRDALSIDNNEQAVLDKLDEIFEKVEAMGGSLLYTLTFDTDGGNEIAHIRDVEGATVNLPTPIKTGYVFYAWTADHGTIDGNTYTFAASDATATASYIVDTSAAVSEANDILANRDDYVDDYLDEVEAKLNALNAIDGSTPENNDDVLAALQALNTVLSHKAENTAFTVTFKVDGGVVKTEKVKAGESATAPEQAEYITGEENHKKFSGWTGDYTNVSADIEITASYQTEDHNWVDGGVTLVPTCSETGTQAQSCVCGATNEKTLNKDSDNHADYGTTVVNDVTAQCNLDGYTGDTVCARCHAVLTAGEIIPKETVAHTYTNNDIKDEALKSAATCTSAAVYYYSCAVCGTVEANDEHTFTDGDPVAHTFTKADVKADALKSEATCTAPAVYYYSCDVCGEVENNDAHTFTDGEPIAHNYTKAEVKEAALKNAATCTAPAEYYYSCVMCGVVESNDEHTFTDGDALGHDWGSGVVTTPATYDTEGVRTYTCSRCGDTKTSAIPKLDSVSDATTVKDIVKADYLYSLDTDARVYYSPNSGVTSSDILAAEISHRNNYVEYSIAILDSGGNGKALSDAVWVAVPLDPTYYGQDTFDVFIVTEDGEQPVDVFYVNGGYVYIKTTTCGTFRVRNTEPSAHDGYRCSFCNTYDSVVNNPNSFFLYRFIITMIHFIIHAFSSLFRF